MDQFVDRSKESSNSSTLLGAGSRASKVPKTGFPPLHNGIESRRPRRLSQKQGRRSKHNSSSASQICLRFCTYLTCQSLRPVPPWFFSPCQSRPCLKLVDRTRNRTWETNLPQGSVVACGTRVRTMFSRDFSPRVL